jgi:hypothetical protein
MHLARLMLFSSFVLACVTCTVSQTSAQAPTNNNQSPAAAMAPPAPLGSEKWEDLPAGATVGVPSVDMGGTVKVAVIQGSPMQAGRPYTVRLYCSDATKIPPHWHPTAENVTVIKGKLAIAMGSTFDASALQDLSAGGFVSVPARMRHFASCKGETVVQVHGMGPFVINFVPAEKSVSGN